MKKMLYISLRLKKLIPSMLFLYNRKQVGPVN